MVIPRPENMESSRLGKPIPVIPFQMTTLAFHPLGGIGKVSRMEDGIL